MLVAPERRMSSCVMTWIAEAASSNLSAWRDTEVTSTFMRSSTFSCFKSPMLGEPELLSALAAAQKLQTAKSESATAHIAFETARGASQWDTGPFEPPHMRVDVTESLRS